MVVLKKGNGMRLLISALTLTVLIIVSATAGSTKRHDGLMVKDVWSRATLAKNGATYMTIFNHGSHMDRLVAVESSVSEKAEMHTHSIKDGVMRMRRIFAVEVHPGAPTVFAPGGNHIMLLGLHKKLVAGEKFHVTLVFEKAGKLTVPVAVGRAGAMRHDRHNNLDHKSRHKHKHGS